MFGLERCALVGMVHLRALPGSPGWAGSMDDVLEVAVSDAEALLAGGCHAVLIENMGDVPYLRGAVPPGTPSLNVVVGAAIFLHHPRLEAQSGVKPELCDPAATNT